jgi:hypothetical protein
MMTFPCPYIRGTEGVPKHPTNIGGEASSRCRRPSDIVDQNADAAEAISRIADDRLRTLGRAEVGCHEQLWVRQVMGGGWCH